MNSMPISVVWINSLRTRRDYNTHRLLRAIGLNTLLSKLPLSQEARQKDRMCPLLIKNTMKISHFMEVKIRTFSGN